MRMEVEAVWAASGAQKTADRWTALTETLKLMAWQASPLPCGPDALPCQEPYLAVEAGGIGGAAQVAMLQVDDILQAWAMSQNPLLMQEPAQLQEASHLSRQGPRVRQECCTSK